jgi:hypothetical protein
LTGRLEGGRALLLPRTTPHPVPYPAGYGGAQGLLYAAGYLGFPEAVVAPFVGVAGLVYQLIVGRLVASILGNFRELGIPAGATTLKE